MHIEGCCTTRFNNFLIAESIFQVGRKLEVLSNPEVKNAMQQSLQVN